MKNILLIVLLLQTLLVGQTSVGTTKTSGITASPANFVYGPQITNFNDAAYTPVSNSCNQTLAAGGSYRLTADLTCTSNSIALALGGLNTKLSLHGFTVTGRIVSIVNPNGNEVFWGKITCSVDDGTAFGCILFDNAATGTFTAVMTIHDLDVTNTATNLGTGTARVAFMNLTGTSANTPDCDVYNNYFHMDTVGNKDSNRIIVFEANGCPNINIHNNQAYCGSEEGACQGLIAYGTTVLANITNNYVSNANLLCPAGVCGDDPRMLGCDATNGCDISYNICNGVFGRCGRLRGVANGKIRDNWVLNSGEGRSGTGLFHLGDNDDAPSGTTASKVGTTVTLTNTVFIPYKSSWRVLVTGCSDTNANTTNAIINKLNSTSFSYSVGISGSTTPTGCVVNVSESNCNNEIYNNKLSFDVDGTKMVWFRGIDCVSVHDNNVATSLPNALSTGDNYLGYLRINGPVTNGTFFRNNGATSIQSAGSGGACGSNHGQICLEADPSIFVTTCKTGTAFGGGTITTSTGC